MEPRTAPRKLVLVIEDNDDVREMLRLLLEMEGYTVATADAGDGAIGMLRSGLKPGVILLDLNMPGKNGDQFRREQLADTGLATIPVIVCSGDSEVASRSSAMGAVAYHRKPVAVDALLSTIAQHC